MLWWGQMGGVVGFGVVGVGGGVVSVVGVRLVERCQKL